MAQLQLPILPRRLYRYRSITRTHEALEQEIDSIRNHYIYCSEFRSMNDPMEGFFESSTGFRADATYRQALQQIKHSKLQLGLACFSETHENVLMWAHYAGNYSGICIEYAAVDLISGLPREASFVRMAYVDELPEVSEIEARNAGDAAVFILSQKKSNWAYEREWRVMAKLGTVSVGLTQPIKAIYFGIRTENSHRRRVLSRIQGTGIKAYMMDVNGFEHSFEPINAEARGPKKRAKVSGSRNKPD